MFESFERAFRGACDGGGVVCLINDASHGPQDVNCKAGVTLERFGANVRDGARGSRDSGNGQGVGSRACITLNRVLGRILVRSLGMK